MKLKESFLKLFFKELDVEDPFLIQLKAIISHFEYSIKDITSYEELTMREQLIISKEVFENICE